MVQAQAVPDFEREVNLSMISARSDDTEASDYQNIVEMMKGLRGKKNKEGLRRKQEDS